MEAKIRLIIQTIENQLELLKMELGEETRPPPENTISIADLIQNPEPEYYEEPDEGPEILLNNAEESTFYEKFKL
jgi:hypothetical protein